MSAEREHRASGESSLEEIAPAFVEMAHRIVWCSVATVDRHGRPRSRILHPIWEWDGEQLTGWVATAPTALKRAHLEHSPFASCSYWEPGHDTCVAECAAELMLGDVTREAVWQRFASAPEPVGYDPAMIPAWREGPHSEGFAALRLRPWRLRVFDGAFLLSGGAEGRLIRWSAPPE